MIVKFSLLVVFTIASCSLYAQVNDFGFWAGINIEKKLNSKLDAQLSEKFRFNENVTELGTELTEIGVNYDLGKGFSAGIAYRFTQKRRLNDHYSSRHRININASYKLKFKKLTITLRECYQTQYADINSSENGSVPQKYLRNKLTFKYTLTEKVIPYLSAELWYQLNNPLGNNFDNARYTLGVDKKINKKNTFGLFYLINKEFNAKNPFTNYVVGINYTYSI